MDAKPSDLFSYINCKVSQWTSMFRSWPLCCSRPTRSHGITLGTVRCRPADQYQKSLHKRVERIFHYVINPNLVVRSLNSARDFTNISKRIASAFFASETFIYAKQVFTGRSDKSALPELRPSKIGKQLIIKIFITLLLLMVGRNCSLLLVLSLFSFPHQATD